MLGVTSSPAICRAPTTDENVSGSRNTRSTSSYFATAHNPNGPIFVTGEFARSAAKNGYGSAIAIGLSKMLNSCVTGSSTAGVRAAVIISAQAKYQQPGLALSIRDSRRQSLQSIVEDFQGAG